jgi:cytochrome d ubiquinol oxidase subunit I
VAAIHAFLLLRDRASHFHRSALGIALALACVSIPLQLLSGDLSARAVGRLQPAKLAAMEALYQTQTGAPLRLGGIPNDAERTTDDAIRIPHGLSLLLTGSLNGKVIGLEAFPKEDWPNVKIVHGSFDIMVASGMAMLALATWSGWLWWRRPPLADHPSLLRALVAAGPLGFVAIETGWVVTEVGRQPWIIYGVMRTRDAVTPMPWLIIPFSIFTGLYVFLALIVFILLRRQFLQTPGLISELSPTSAHV